MGNRLFFSYCNFVFIFLLFNGHFCIPLFFINFYFNKKKPDVRHQSTYRSQGIALVNHSTHREKTLLQTTLYVLSRHGLTESRKEENQIN